MRPEPYPITFDRGIRQEYWSKHEILKSRDFSYFPVGTSVVTSDDLRAAGWVPKSELDEPVQS